MADERATPRVITFGCRLNAFESEVLRANAEAAGNADTIVVNTCAVTAEAERQARQAIRRARRENPDARIVVTGCAAQTDPQSFARMPEVDSVIGNAEKMTRAAFAPEGARVRVNDIMEASETASHLISGFDGRARAFVQVQNGCDHRCTFCIIPFGRGPSRSTPADAVARQIAALVDGGCREIVLTGVDLTDYGRDLPGEPRLGDLVATVLDRVPGLTRLRLSSIDVAEIDDTLVDLLGHEPRVMPHVHVSLQSGDDMILKRMKRRHSRADAVEFCNRLAATRSDIAFGADLIAGFPTETEAQFLGTLDLVTDCGLAYLHVFPYSERAGTPAARMPIVPLAVRRERAARLRRAGDEALRRFLARRIGREENVLVEQGRHGRTEHYAPIELDADHEPGTVVGARAAAVAEGPRGPVLTGEIRASHRAA